MHATEGRGIFYDYVRLEGIDLTSESGEAFDRAYAYNCRADCLNFGGREAAVAIVPAAGRRFPELSQAEAQEAVRRNLGESAPLAEFVLAAVHDQAVRCAREARLCVDAIPFAWPRATVIAGEDRGAR